MCLIRPAVFATLLFATTAHAGAGNATRYLDLVNRAHDSVVFLEVAPAGSNAFQQQPLGESLHGGGGSTTIQITGEGCVYDMRLKFRNGRTLVYNEADVCEGNRLVIRPMPPRASGLVGPKQSGAQYADGYIP